MTEIDITGLSKAQVLAALFNASAPQGMGVLQAGRGPQVMDLEFAEEITREYLVFDYLFGRPLKLDLSGQSFDPRLFDLDNGGAGTAQLIIDRLRAAVA
jgi:hypothetical protein